MQDLAGALASGLKPHLPDGVSAAAVTPTTLAIRFVATMQPTEGYGSAPALKYDLKQAGASDGLDDATISAVLSVLAGIQADLSEWSGRRWPPFPTATTADGAEPASWTEPAQGPAGDVTTAVGYTSESGWSLRIASVRP